MCKRLVVEIENPDLNKRRCMELIDSELQIPELRPFDCPDMIRHVTQKLGRCGCIRYDCYLHQRK